MWKKLKETLKNFKAENLKAKNPELQKREVIQDDHGNWYINEEGLTVFTEKYLLERGYCCENGCKHCPYGYRKPPIKKS